MIHRKSPDAREWQRRLEVIYEAMREMSAHSDPQEMVRAYTRLMQQIFPVDRSISLSRRRLQPPNVRVTRDSRWEDDINPWQQPERLPLLRGGLFAELVYGEKPRILDQLQLSKDDPARPYLEGQQSLMAIPLLDQGVALNMVILTREQPAAFEHERFPDHVWLANLFGQATHNLVLSEKVRQAYEMVDREMKIVADIQQSLLPKTMPHIPTLTLAAYYRTSERAGGDYYDFFPLPDGKWGILIADVSGHGTPAAVVMAITHSIAHLYPGQSGRPSDMLKFVNQQLTTRYREGLGAFVTAFYGIYEPDTRVLTYSSAGHNPPRLKHCGTMALISLDEATNIPLGVMPDVDYGDHVAQLKPGDCLVLYTDGFTEALNAEGRMFGIERLDQLIDRGCGVAAETTVKRIVDAVDRFTGGARLVDDRTLLVAKVS